VKFRWSPINTYNKVTDVLYILKYEWLQTINEETTPLNPTQTKNHKAIVPIPNVQATNIQIEDFDTVGCIKVQVMLQRSKDRLFYLSIIFVMMLIFFAIVLLKDLDYRSLFNAQ
jgi:hypothetical protein